MQNKFICVGLLLAVCIYLVACGSSIPPAFPSILTTVAPVAKGQGIPEAADYHPNESETPKLVLLTKTGEPHEWNQTLPRDWLPSSVNEIELVVFIGSEREVDLGSEIYQGTNSKTVTRYLFEIDIEIREARTGNIVVERAAVSGSEPEPFPDKLAAGVNRIVGGSYGSCIQRGFLPRWADPSHS